MRLLALFGRVLEKLQSHSKFRMCHQYDARRTKFSVGNLDRNRDPRASGERRARRKIAPAKTEVSQTANHRWIVRFGFGKLTVQPIAQHLALFVARILETYAGGIVAASPRQLSIDFERFASARQGEREAQRTLFGPASGKPNRHPAFAQVQGRSFVTVGSKAFD